MLCFLKAAQVASSLELEIVNHPFHGLQQLFELDGDVQGWTNPPLFSAHQERQVPIATSAGAPQKVSSNNASLGM